MNHAIIQQCDRLLDELKALRPVERNHIAEIRSYWRVALTYSSNAIEGNTLSESETKVILEDGLTIGGKSLREHFEAIGHGDALAMLYKALDAGKTVSEELILEVHRLFYFRIDQEMAGKYRNRNVLITGATYLPPSSTEVPLRIKELLGSVTKGATHPIACAAEFHNSFVNIHPFVDGNGRTARLLVNLLLMKGGFPIVTIPPIFRARFITACESGSFSRPSNYGIDKGNRT